MTLHIAGLGPGSASLLTVAVRDLLASGLPVLLRTAHHPTVAELDPGRAWASCDDIYQRGLSFEEAYAAVVERVIAFAEAGDGVYAVPGHPLMAEATVAGVLAVAKERDIGVKLYPGVSFADVAATALGVDFERVQLCDALALRIDTQRPALISQVFDRDAAAGLKLDLLDVYPSDHPVTVLRALGGADERVDTVPLAELDRRPWSYLDSVFVPAIAAEDDVRRFDGLRAIVARLHAPGGCPWDREQTHTSLRQHLLEECYETLDAIDAGDSARLTEELGDVLLQVLMHAEVGQREGTLGLADVVEHIGRKLVRRHPHVFGGTTAESAEEVALKWDALKQQEKPRSSILEGIPVALPALAESQSIQGRARRIGFDWPDIEGPLEKLSEEMHEFARAEAGDGDREDEFGDILFVVANIAQRLGIDAEQALRGANAKFRRRFGLVEELARERALDLRDLDLAGLDALWDEAKVRLAGAPGQA
ncbi:MAG: nucleoside triphosphate pyrophosphohydrolase [Dehalococcoidia bacterium]|nr:nucleoside triphosphate pyrophosphohydrolase [Dehalococcoidia bacterium]